MVVAIKPCSCRSDYQDATYGKGNRLHNQMKDKTKYRCTVCSDVKGGSYAERIQHNSD